VSKWITQNTKISGKRIYFVNTVKKKNTFSKESQDYIKQYQLIYKRALKEAKKGGGGE
jgi:hypothetical protein